MSGFQLSRQSIRVGIFLLVALIYTLDSAGFPQQDGHRLAKRHPLAVAIQQQQAAAPQVRPETGNPPSPVTAQQLSANPTPRRTVRITKAPKNRGHFLTTNRFDFRSAGATRSGSTEYLMPGRFKVSDYNSAEVDDRVIFRYRLYQDSLDFQSNGPAQSWSRQADASQFVVGIERVFGDCCDRSIEVHLPLFANGNAEDPAGLFSTNQISTGNLVLITKKMMYQSNEWTLSRGLGFSLPTGDNIEFNTIDEHFELQNESVHIQPYLAALWRPSCDWFVHGFLQFDVATRGNDLVYQEVGSGLAGMTGRLNDQTLLGADVSVGRWWFRDRIRSGVTALSTSLEIHYATSLNEANLVSGTTALNSFLLGPASARFDSLDITAGFDLHFDDHMVLRAGWVVPLRGGDDRFFDNEVQLSLNGQF